MRRNHYAASESEGQQRRASVADLVALARITSWTMKLACKKSFPKRNNPESVILDPHRKLSATLCSLPSDAQPCAQSRSLRCFALDVPATFEVMSTWT